MIIMVKAMIEERKEKEQKEFFLSFSFFALVIAIVVILTVRGRVLTLISRPFLW